MIYVLNISKNHKNKKKYFLHILYIFLKNYTFLNNVFVDYNHNIPSTSQALSLQESQSLRVDLLIRTMSSSVKPAHFSVDIFLDSKMAYVIIINTAEIKIKDTH